MKADSEVNDKPSPEESPEVQGPAPVEELREQARRLRSASRMDRTAPSDPSFFGKVLYLVFFAAVMGSSIYLLMFPGVRQGMVLEVSDWWIAAARDVTRSHIYRLPPPPPKPAEKKVMFQAPVPVVIGTNVPDGGAAPEAEEASGASRQVKALKKTRDSETAYRLLLEKSVSARDLTEGKIPGQAFKEWRLVKDSVPLFWIDLVAAREPGPEVHLIWAVDLENRTVNALSQAARDLEQSGSN